MKGGRLKIESKKAVPKLPVKKGGAVAGKKPVKKGKAVKDPNKPKRPASAFFIFMEDFIKQYKEKHPNNKSVAAVGKAGGDKWKSLSEAGHEGRFSVYVHASKGKPVHFSSYFINREIRSDKVIWGNISMVDAERRLLANALKDPDNQQFVLLSDSCVPLREFYYVYNYLMYTNTTFVDCSEDPGPHGNC